MLYKSVDDFYRHIANLKIANPKRLSREEEKEYAIRMKEGDEEAYQALIDSYLPVLGSYLKRYTHTPSLDMIYRGLEVLNTALRTYNFLHESTSPNVNFACYLSDKVRRTMTRYIATD